MSKLLKGYRLQELVSKFLNSKTDNNIESAKSYTLGFKDGYEFLLKEIKNESDQVLADIDEAVRIGVKPSVIDQLKTLYIENATTGFELEETKFSEGDLQ